MLSISIKICQIFFLKTDIWKCMAKISKKLQIYAQNNAILTALLLVSNAFLCNMRYTGILKSRERCIENEWNFGILKKSMSDENDSFVGKCRHVINTGKKNHPWKSGRNMVSTVTTVTLKFSNLQNSESLNVLHLILYFEMALMK